MKRESSKKSEKKKSLAGDTVKSFLKNSIVESIYSE
jgi:hypothetical protein